MITFAHKVENFRDQLKQFRGNLQFLKIILGDIQLKF